MPHSSGGGSHGGGSHGGSHGGSSSRSARRSTYFPGAHKYVYYKNNRPVYYYRKDTIKTPEQKKPMRILLACFFVLFYSCFIIPCILLCFHRPKKIKMDYADTMIRISDTIDVMTEEEEMQLGDTLYEFQKLTGITPVVVTCPNDAWQGKYSTMEDFAYDFYVNQFADEKHWLIMYSQPEEVGDFNDWYWEGMQGDDTDPVLTSKWADTFTENAHKYLLIDDITVAGAFDRAFRDLMPGIMENSFEPAPLLGLVFVLIHGGIMGLAFFGTSKSEDKIDNSSIELNPTAPVQEDVCEYCKGIYVHGIHYSCPHCGAPIKPAQESGGYNLNGVNVGGGNPAPSTSGGYNLNGTYVNGNQS